MFSKTGAKPSSDKIQRFLVKLTLIHSLSFFLSILVVTLLIYLGFKRNLEKEDDHFLVQKYESVQHMLDLYNPRDSEFEKQIGLGGHEKKAFFYVRIQDLNRNTIFSSSQELEKEITSGEEKIKVQEETYQFLNTETRDERKYRAIRATHPTNSVGGYYVEVWMDRTSDDNVLADYGRLILLALIVSLILSPTIGYTLAKKALRPVRDNMKRLAQFSDDLAHELRTPLNNLRGEIEISLSQKREPREYVDTMSSALEELDRLKKIIDGLLFVTRVEQDQFTLSQSEFSVRKELESVIEFYEPSADERGVKLVFAGVAEEIQITANKALFQQAIGNLVANAIKFTPSEGRVEISYSRIGAHCCVSVNDTGLGIEPDHAPLIFDRFYRVDAARSRDAGGLGLGLAIAKSISEIHGGYIAVESEPGRGSRFSVSFRI